MKENAVVTTTSSHNKTTPTATPAQFIIPLYPDYTLAVKIVDVFPALESGLHQIFFVSKNIFTCGV